MTPDDIAAIEEIRSRVDALEKAFASLLRSDTLFTSGDISTGEALEAARKWLEQYDGS